MRRRNGGLRLTAFSAFAMADKPAAAPAAAAPVPAPALRKGSLVKLDRTAWEGSQEAGASAPDLPDYLVEGPGEILAIRGDHAQLRWRRPVPDVWLRLDQLVAWEPSSGS